MHCQICGQSIDFYVGSFSTHPFIDGERYKCLCFTCAQVPEDFVQTYSENGDIVEQHGPYFDWKHLRTPEQLLSIGAATDLREAKNSVVAVRRKLKSVGAQKLNKLKLIRPKTIFYFDDKELIQNAPRKSIHRHKPQKRQTSH